MTKGEYELLIERMTDYAEHWENGQDLKFSTAVKTGMRLMIREVKRIYETEDRV